MIQKNLVFAISLFLVPVVDGAALAGCGDTASTAYEVIDVVRIQRRDTDAVYYFESADRNWSAAACPNARFAYMYSTDAGVESILSTALVSKTSGTTIRFDGTCCSGSDDKYLRIDYVYLE